MRKKIGLILCTAAISVFMTTGIFAAVEEEMPINETTKIETLEETAEEVIPETTQKQASLAGWQMKDKNVYYYKNGEVVKGLQKIDGDLYYFNEQSGELSVPTYKSTGWNTDKTMTYQGNKYYFGERSKAYTGWTQNDAYTYYSDRGTGFRTNIEYLQADGIYYRMDKAGRRSNSESWVAVDGEQYYMDNSGKMVTGYQSISERSYFFQKDGKLAANTTFTLDGKTYKTNEDGIVIHGKGWLTLGNKWYYFPTPLKKGYTRWNKIDGKWYYFDLSCVMQTGWTYVTGQWYYMNSSGVMQTGWVKSGGVWYYMNSSGEMQKGWIKSGGQWYYMNSSGVMQTGWVKSGGQWYYMNGSGVMQTGWKKYAGQWYWLTSSGSAQTGWKKISNYWYYFESSGAMQTGWKKYAGYWYYLTENGAYQSKTVTISGTKYTFDANAHML